MFMAGVATEKERQCVRIATHADATVEYGHALIRSARESATLMEQCTSPLSTDTITNLARFLLLSQLTYFALYASFV